MDGISAVTARISEIRALVHPAPLRPAAPPPSVAVATAAPARSSTGSPVPFADALATALAGGGPASAATGPSVAALKSTYRNGRIPAEALVPIGRGEHRLAAPAATALSALLATAERDGIDIGVTDSYRSFEAQVDVARRKGLYSQGGLAAEPGTSSHGWGLAVDLDLDADAQAWMRTHAGRFGFVEDTPREPWHWAFSG